MGIRRDQERLLLGQGGVALYVGGVSCWLIGELTVTGMRAPEVMGNDPSPLSLTYRMSISSTAFSTVVVDAFNRAILLRPMFPSMSTTARSSN